MVCRLRIAELFTELGISYLQSIRGYLTGLGDLFLMTLSRTVSTGTSIQTLIY